jgi:hypothetical protein
LALVLATGVATAIYRTSSGAPDPAQVVPSNAFAVATLDFHLASGQEAAINRMLGLFPEIKLAGGGSFKDRVFRALTQASPPFVDYDTRVKPWLGDRVAIAGWLDKGTARVEVILESLNDSAVRQHAAKAFGPHAHYRLRDGFVIFGEGQADVDNAVAAAAKSSLATSGAYENDLARLPSGEAVTAWVNGSAIGPLFRQSLSASDERIALFTFGAIGAVSLDDVLRSRFAIGAHVTGDAIRVDVRGVGGTPRKSAPTSMLKSLPARTIGAVEIGDPSAFTDELMRLLQILGPEIASSLGRVPEGFPKDPAGIFGLALGIRIPEDIKTILGDRAVLTFGGLEPGALPDMAIRTHPTGQTRAMGYVQTVRARLSAEGAINVDVSTLSHDVVLASSRSYGQEIGASGTFGQQPRVKAALGDMPGQVSTAGYLDLSRIWPLVGTAIPPDVQHLQAVGYWVVDGGDVQAAQFSLVID